ncbi:hypothetical protein RhiJN_13614 [Ceratobasidium sp. AG-Ba]|nr:hypothetical protein RhiJN_13614 [Ceratobasidium sp. AG-Ba]
MVWDAFTFGVSFGFGFFACLTTIANIEWTREPTQAPSNSHSTPNYAMNVLNQRSYTGTGQHTPNHLVATKHDAWLEPGLDQKRSAHNHGHVRRPSSGAFDFSDGDADLTRVHVVVEREVRYDENGSVSEKSISDVNAKK